jgi:hypothetical protein
LRQHPYFIFSADTSCGNIHILYFLSPQVVATSIFEIFHRHNLRQHPYFRFFVATTCGNVHILFFPSPQLAATSTFYIMYCRNLRRHPYFIFFVATTCSSIHIKLILTKWPAWASKGKISVKKTGKYVNMLIFRLLSHMKRHRTKIQRYAASCPDYRIFVSDEFTGKKHTGL